MLRSRLKSLFRRPRRDRYVREDGRGPVTRVAEWGLYAFSIFASIVMPAFAVAGIFVVQSPRAVVIGGCFITAAILVLLLILENSSPMRYAPRRGVMIAMAAAFTLFGGWSTEIALTQDEANVARSPLRKGTDIKVNWRPFRLAEAPNGVLWAGEKNARIHSIDTSLRQPTGTPIRVGNALHDLDYFDGFVFATVDRGKVVRIDPDPTGGPPLTRHYGKDGGELVSDGSSLFVNDRSQATVFRLSFNLVLLKAIPINANSEARATAIALGGDGYLWVVDAGLNALYKVSLESNEVVRSKTIPPGPAALLVINKIVYIAHPALGFVERRAASNAELLPGRIRIDPGPTQLRAANDLLFVCSSQTNEISSVSLETGRPVGPALAVGTMPTDLDFGPNADEKGWVASDEDSLTPVTLGQDSSPPKQSGS